MKEKRSISLYWKCQLIGWSAASLYWGYKGFSGTNFSFPLAVLQFIGDLFIYIFITHLYRNLSFKYRWHTLNTKDLLKRIIPAVLVLGLLFMGFTITKLYLVRLIFQPHFTDSFWHYFQQNRELTFITGIRLMSIWVLAYYLYHYAQREINTVKENARLAIITRDAQLNNLSAQLNPHFLFNSLNNIKALVIENPKSARRAIDLLSDILRKALYGRDIQLTTIKDELDLVKDYLELEKLRWEERLQQYIEMDYSLEQALILRLSVQTLVENAVKHGIGQQKDGGTVSVKIISLNEFIEISVQNPGSLDVTKSAEGIGLQNLRERLELQYKGKALFSITDQHDGLVLAKILIPTL